MDPTRALLGSVFGLTLLSSLCNGGAFAVLLFHHHDASLRSRHSLLGGVRCGREVAPYLDVL